MADIRIDSLPVADYQQPSDMFALQRNVAGVWTDFRSNFAAMSGDVQVAIVQWDLDNPGGAIATIVTPAVDEIAVFISGIVLYTPDGLPSGDPVQVLIVDDNGSYAAAEFDTSGTVSGFQFFDTIETSGMATPMRIEQSAGGAPNGTAKALIQYVVIRL